jgi:hypothetical protein
MEYNYLSIGLAIGALITLVIFLFINSKKTKEHHETVTALKLTEDRLKNAQIFQQQLTEKITLKDKEITSLQVKTATLESNLGNELKKNGELSVSLIDEAKESKCRQEQINDMVEQRAEQSADRVNLAKNLATLKELHEKLTVEMRVATLELKNQTATISRLTA